MRRRIIFDLLLTVLLLFEVLHQITGNMLHEVVGAAFFVCIIVHLAFASRWIKGAAGSLKEGELAKRQKKLAIIAILLAIDVLVLLASSIIISETLWGWGVNLTALNPGNIFYPIHTVAAYALCILVLGHLSMHWITVAETLSVSYDPSRREAITSALNGVVMIGGIALGVIGFTRAGFQASDYSINLDEDSKTVESGYRERDAHTGEYTTNHSFEAAVITESDSSKEESSGSGEDDGAARCPICPRQCKLSSPRCGRPKEAGLI